ncbi:BRI3-binding protein isoform X2 [Pipistrellus kuhlii]|uniref:BRI3 binding protein n=1 Tax=Pipistrellus kuhlii TaxID=59472 RepID=A0A7J7RGT8_PIPKU|nr:BRI3-binding protein isoform X2 [Pipistrellus kuhlii]KAF6275237.1 BRI3 binding protein [Pipistrellus kuhlii]
MGARAAGWPRARAGLLLLPLLLALLAAGAQGARGRGGAEKTSYRRAAGPFWPSAASLLGEDNARAAHKVLTRLTEKFVHSVDVFLDVLWKLWVEILDVLGLDVANMSQYLSPAAMAGSPARAVVFIGVLMLAYWFLSLALGLAVAAMHLLFGRCFWAARVALFSLACVYVLHKHEGEPEAAALPLCFVVAAYFMTGPMGPCWRSPPGPPPGPGLEEKLEQLDAQVRLLNIRLNRVLEGLDGAAGGK